MNGCESKMKSSLTNKDSLWVCAILVLTTSFQAKDVHFRIASYVSLNSRVLLPCGQRPCVG